MNKFLKGVLTTLLMVGLAAGLFFGLKFLTDKGPEPYEVWSGVTSSFSDGTMVIIEKGNKVTVKIFRTAEYNGLPIENRELPRAGIQYKLFPVYDESFIKKIVGYRLEWIGYTEWGD